MKENHSLYCYSKINGEEDDFKIYDKSILSIERLLLKIDIKFSGNIT